MISTSFLSMVRSLFWRVEEACQLLVLNLSTNVVDLGISLLFYLRTASINIFNGMVSLTFSCDGSHYMRYDEFLAKGAAFWSGVVAA